MTVARTVIATLETTGTHTGGFPVRPRRIVSTSRNTALHAGHRHAFERRPIGAISVPSFGQAHAFSAASVIFTPRDRVHQVDGRDSLSPSTLAMGRSVIVDAG
jgi:hypothetical protein